MAEILCPYCVNVTGIITGELVRFPGHRIEHANNGPYKEWCPIGGKVFSMTDVFESCSSCEQVIRVLRKSDQSTILVGHHYSWGSNEAGERIKVAPHGGYFSRVMCNSHVTESPIFVTENLPALPVGILGIQTQSAMLN